MKEDKYVDLQQTYTFIPLDVRFRRLLSSSDIGEGWWRCRERRHQEGGQVR